MPTSWKSGATAAKISPFENLPALNRCYAVTDARSPVSFVYDSYTDLLLGLSFWRSLCKAE